LLAKAGTGIPGAVLGAFPVAAALIIAGVMLRDRRRRRLSPEPVPAVRT
jgi:cytochrome c-type biogenesis protein CcmH/NrfF